MNIIEDIEENRFVEPWNNPWFLIPLLLIMMAGAFFVAYLGLYHTDQAGFLLVIVSIVGFLMLVVILKGYLTRSFDIYIEEKQLRTESMFRQKWNIEYSAIKKIKVYSNFGAPQVKLSNGNKKKIIIGSSVTKFGELIEKILERATDCEEFNKEELNIFIKRPDIWQKDMDWNIINRAAMRAKENKDRNPTKEKNR